MGLVSCGTWWFVFFLFFCLFVCLSVRWWILLHRSQQQQRRRRRTEGATTPRRRYSRPQWQSQSSSRSVVVVQRKRKKKSQRGEHGCWPAGQENPAPSKYDPNEDERRHVPRRRRWHLPHGGRVPHGSGLDNFGIEGGTTQDRETALAASIGINFDEALCRTTRPTAQSCPLLHLLVHSPAAEGRQRRLPVGRYRLRQGHFQNSLLPFIIVASSWIWLRHRASCTLFWASWTSRGDSGNWPPSSTTELAHWKSTFVPKSVVNISTTRVFVSLAILSFFSLFLFFRVVPSVCLSDVIHSCWKNRTALPRASLMLLWPLPCLPLSLSLTLSFEKKKHWIIWELDCLIYRFQILEQLMGYSPSAIKSMMAKGGDGKRLSQQVSAYLAPFFDRKIKNEKKSLAIDLFLFVYPFGTSLPLFDMHYIIYSGRAIPLFQLIGLRRSYIRASLWWCSADVTARTIETFVANFFSFSFIISSLLWIDARSSVIHGDPSLSLSPQFPIGIPSGNSRRRRVGCAY